MYSMLKPENHIIRNWVMIICGFAAGWLIGERIFGSTSQK